MTTNRNVHGDLSILTLLPKPRKQLANINQVLCFFSNTKTVGRKYFKNYYNGNKYFSLS